MRTFIWCVFHVEGVVPRQTTFILCNIVSAFGLIDSDLALGSHVVKVLIRMHTSFLGRSPRGRVYTRRSPPRAVFLLPVYEQCDGVFCLWHAAQIRGYSFRRAACHLRRPVFGNHRLANIDVVRVEVVADIAVLSSPGLERFQLRFGLRHVRVEVVELAQAALDCTVACIGVCWVETLVVFNVDEDVVLAGFFEKVLVLFESLDGRLGDHDVDLSLDGIERDRIVSRVRREDGDGIAGTEGIDGSLVGLGVSLIVIGKAREAGVEAIVGLRDVLLEMLLDRWEFVAGCAYHAQLSNFSSPSQVEERESDNSNFLVAAARSTTDESGGVFARSDHTYIERRHGE